MSTKVDLDALEVTAKAMARWEDENLASEQECVGCHNGMMTPSELEPTPLCDLCSQNVAVEMPALIARIRELEAALTDAAARVSTATDVIEEAGICDEEDGEVEESREYVALLRSIVADGARR